MAGIFDDGTTPLKNLNKGYKNDDLNDREDYNEFMNEFRHGEEDFKNKKRVGFEKQFQTPQVNSSKASNLKSFNERTNGVKS